MYARVLNGRLFQGPLSLSREVAGACANWHDATPTRRSVACGSSSNLRAISDSGDAYRNTHFQSHQAKKITFLGTWMGNGNASGDRLLASVTCLESLSAAITSSGVLHRRPARTVDVSVYLPRVVLQAWIWEIMVLRCQISLEIRPARNYE
jgi:hypothetical protein